MSGMKRWRRRDDGPYEDMPVTAPPSHCRRNPPGARFFREHQPIVRFRRRLPWSSPVETAGPGDQLLIDASWVGVAGLGSQCTCLDVDILQNGKSVAHQSGCGLESHGHDDIYGAAVSNSTTCFLRAGRQVAGAAM